MERRHFELEAGYLNIDAHGLYRSASGNWDEVSKLPERSIRSRVRRMVISAFGIALLAVRILFELLHPGAWDTGRLVLGIAIAGVGTVVLVNAFRHDLAPSFRIPFAKVRYLAAEGDRITVHFMNGDDREDNVMIQAPPEAVEMARKAFMASREARVH